MHIVHVAATGEGRASSREYHGPNGVISLNGMHELLEAGDDLVTRDWVPLFRKIDRPDLNVSLGPNKHRLSHTPIPLQRCPLDSVEYPLAISEGTSDSGRVPGRLDRADEESGLLGGAHRHYIVIFIPDFNESIRHVLNSQVRLEDAAGCGDE